MKSNDVEFLEELEKDLQRIGAEYRADQLSQVVRNVQEMERIIADKRTEADLIVALEEVTATNNRMEKLLIEASDRLFQLGKENRELKAKVAP